MTAKVWLMCTISLLHSTREVRLAHITVVIA